MTGQKWEHLPESKIMKERLDAAEAKLTTLADKIRHVRTQIFLHYRRVWRVGFITPGVLLIVGSFVVGVILNNPAPLLGALFGVLIGFVGIVGPASGEELIIKRCHCAECDGRKDLR
jgi:uncharacterized membrane protein YccC